MIPRIVSWGLMADMRNFFLAAASLLLLALAWSAGPALADCAAVLHRSLP
jgi:hypothetical protein